MRQNTLPQTGISFEPCADKFDDLFKSREGKSIAELFSEKSDSIPVEELTRTVAENLKTRKI
jgi:hypothetical protein